MPAVDLSNVDLSSVGGAVHAKHIQSTLGPRVAAESSIGDANDHLLEEALAGHTDGAVKRQTLTEALEYLWQGYPIAK